MCLLSAQDTLPSLQLQPAQQSIEIAPLTGSQSMGKQASERAMSSHTHTPSAASTGDTECPITKRNSSVWDHFNPWIISQCSINRHVPICIYSLHWYTLYIEKQLIFYFTSENISNVRVRHIDETESCKVMPDARKFFCSPHHVFKVPFII